MAIKSDNGLAAWHAAMERSRIGAREAAMETLIKGAYQMASVARALAPEDTGALKRSIAVTLPGQTTPPYSQPGGSRTAAENEVIVTAGNAEVRTAHLVQYGTSKMEARDYFWLAYRLSIPRIRENAARRYKFRVRKAWNSK